MSTSENAGAVRQEQILQALRVVQDPDLHKDIVTLGFVKNLSIRGGSVSFDIELTTPACPVKERLKQEATAAVQALPGVESVSVNMTAQVRKGMTSPADGGMRHVKNAIAVASGKGGVGKSTVAINLALALARTGARVGLMDADVYGPSVPTMLGGRERPEAGSQPGWIKPAERHGIKFVSMGLFTGRDTPVIWRGPMASKLIQQFVGQVEWGELDYLLIDLPPGTGDVQLTLTQSAPLVGAVVVTTPQEVAVSVTRRGLRMFEEVYVPILGIVENMSGFACSHCGEVTDVFRRGGGKQAAAEMGVPFLGEIPLDTAIAEASDSGLPVVREDLIAAEAPSAKAFLEVAGKVAQQVSIVTTATASMRHHPAEVRLEDGFVQIRWSDDQESRLGHRDLRLACRCAVCVDEVTGEKRLDPSTVPADVRAMELRTVGRYALQFNWSDGHNTGIYKYDYLRELGTTSPVEAPERSKLHLPVIGS
jgi:ATP-binding protein involved in chromosome partitioning